MHRKGDQKRIQRFSARPALKKSDPSILVYHFPRVLKNACIINNNHIREKKKIEPVNPTHRQNQPKSMVCENFFLSVLLFSRNRGHHIFLPPLYATILL